MKYTKDFPPLKGDRVLYTSPETGITHYGRIVFTIGESISLKCKNIEVTCNFDQVTIFKPCPWYLFWQKI